MDSEIYKITFDLNSDVGDDLTKLNSKISALGASTAQQAKASKLDTLGTISAFSAAMSKQKTKTVIQEKERVRTLYKTKEVVKEVTPSNVVPYSEFQKVLDEKIRLNNYVEANKQYIKMGQGYPKLQSRFNQIYKQNKENEIIIKYNSKTIERLHKEVAQLQLENKQLKTVTKLASYQSIGIHDITGLPKANKAIKQLSTPAIKALGDDEFEIDIYDLIKNKQRIGG